MKSPGVKIVVLVISMTCCLAAPAASAAEAPPLRLAATIPLKNVEGRIDHLSLDAKNDRLFLAALGNGTVEMLDLRAAKQAGRIEKLDEPQGVCWLADLERLVVACGGDGTVRFYDSSLKPLATIEKLSDADNVRYDAAGKRVYVGYGGGALAVIDPQKMTRLADIELLGHPESFQLDPAASRAYVNVPTARHIAIVDLEKLRQLDSYEVPHGARNNFPMALDAAGKRMFVACRAPARLVALDVSTGKMLCEVDCAGDADDVFFDGQRKRVYVSGGDGHVSVIDASGGERCQLIANISTAAGARTSFLDAASGRLFVAVPHRGGQAAEVRVYEPANR